MQNYNGDGYQNQIPRMVDNLDLAELQYMLQQAELCGLNGAHLSAKTSGVRMRAEDASSLTMASTKISNIIA